MKTLFISIICISQYLISFGQTPEWYYKEMERQVGTWIADNSEYQTDNEKDDAYALEWRYSAGKQGLLGILYGIREGQKTNEYWQFFQFWDIIENKVRVIQVFAFSPTFGEGFLEKISPNENKLVQTFITPDGRKFEEGHTYLINDNYEITTSFKIENSEWIKKRTYKWVKQ